MISSTRSTWDHYVQHAFVKQLGRGILDPQCFKHFITCVLSPNFVDYAELVASVSLYLVKTIYTSSTTLVLIGK